MACEFSHLIAHSKIGNKFKAALNLDMSKAFDHVSWCFLDLTLQKMGFSEKWVTFLHQCFTIVSSSLLFNANPSDRFFPQRDLRQGDPLSLYLFIIYLETLSYVLARLNEEGKCKGLQLSRNGESLSYLFFADDCLIFFNLPLIV